MALLKSPVDHRKLHSDSHPHYAAREIKIKKARLNLLLENNQCVFKNTLWLSVQRNQSILLTLHHSGYVQATWAKRTKEHMFIRRIFLEMQVYSSVNKSPLKHNQVNLVYPRNIQKFFLNHIKCQLLTLKMSSFLPLVLPLTDLIFLLLFNSHLCSIHVQSIHSLTHRLFHSYT